MNKAERLEYLEQTFSDSVTFDQDWKDEAKTRYGYYHGEQWSSEEIEGLQNRNQAVTTYNHIAPAIDSIIGGERQNRPKVTMAGRTPDDEKIAQVKTSLYDYIQYNSKTDDELDKMLLDSLVAGRGWMYITPVIESDEKAELAHQWIDYRDMFIDSLSKRSDCEDARYLHYAIYTDSDIVDKMFDNYDPDTDGSDEMRSFESSSDDELWFEKNNRDRPRLITSWYKDENGALTTSIWVKGKELYNKKVPYTMTRYPYVKVDYKRTLDNRPYGLVKTMISAQDEINKRHSKALHYLNARQVLAEENAFVNWSNAEKTLAQPDGITKLVDGALNENRVQIVNNVQLADAHIKLMGIAEDKLLSSAGINPASIGQSSQYESAKKANLSINQAQSTLVPFLNKIRIARHDLAYITLSLVPDYYTEEQLIRILAPTGEYEFMPINQVQLMDDGTLVKFNDVTNNDIDIIIEDAPRGLNEREEQFAQLMTIQGQTQRPIPMEILLRYSSIKDKYQLASELEAHYSQEAQLQQAQQVIEQQQQQIQQLGGTVNQITSQLTQSNIQREVDSAVNKVVVQLEKEKGNLKAKI